MKRWFDDLKIAVKLTMAPALAILGIIGLTTGHISCSGPWRMILFT